MSTTIESLELEITANSKSAVDGIDALTQSLLKLKDAVKGLGLKGVAKDISGISEAAKSVKNSGSSFTDFYHKISSGINTIKRVGSSLYSAVEKSMDYTENMNLFTVSMGSYAGEALAYAEEVSGAMGIDTSEWIRAQGIFMTMATGFGVSSDRAATMSKNLTQLGYDLSSFYNMDVGTAMLKLKSGLAGELEPLRAIGYDLSQAKLEATALELGIGKTVSSMTQAEKAQLRYYAIMTQVTDAHGDMARTLDDPANQMRVFKAEISMATREIGNAFIPALNAILPYAIAVTKVIGALASGIAGLFGYEEPGVDESTKQVVENTGAVTENIQDAQAEAKKLKSYMLGIDELNVINPNTDSTEDTSGMFDFELPEYDFMEGLVESKVNAIVEEMKEWLGITEDINSWSDLLATNFGNILVTIGLIGVGIGAWKIGKGITTFMKDFKSFAKGLKALGAIAVIGAAIAGASWLVTNTEDTMTQIGGILSGAALGVGAILAFTGINLPLGIALMAVGAVSMASAIAMNTDKLSDDVKGVIAVITSAVSVALLAVGAVLAFTGVNIPLGIALMAGGALTMATAILPNWDALSDSVQNTISIITGAVGLASLAVGAILAFSGADIPLGIGLMIVGAAGLATAVALNWDSIKTALEGPVGGVTALIGGASLALGALLAFSGANIPLGIALMVVGAGSLATVVSLNWNAILDSLSGPLGAVTALVSTAVLALGALLTFSGANIPLGIGLMLVGAAGLATVVAVNWNSIVEAIRGPVGLIMAILGAALLVIGAILLFTGAGIPLGLGLMLAGAASLGTAIAVNWDKIPGILNTVLASILAIVSGSLLVIGVLMLLSGVGIGLGLAVIAAGLAGSYVAWKLDDNPVTRFVKNMANGIINIINEVIDAINDMFHIQFTGLVIAGAEIIPAFDTRLINLPRIPLMADGGFLEQGQMFIAREAGAEMVGNIGRRTAVANNDQIVSGIAGGVAEANEEQNVLLREQNSLLRAILEKDSGVYLDGKNLTNSVEKYQRERGRVLVTGGVL